MTERNRFSQPIELLPAHGSGDDDGSGGLVQVATGLYAERLPVGGLSITEVRNGFADRLDIAPDSVAVLDGQLVEDETTTIRAGQQLAFIRAAGEKGVAA